MVLRGAQFQRSGPAGYAFLTRRALSSYLAKFIQEQSDAISLRYGGLMRRGLQVDSTADISTGPLTKDSRRMTRAGDVCHGHIGESSLG